MLPTYAHPAMDEDRPLPTAAELGISEAEYARILRAQGLEPLYVADVTRAARAPQVRQVRWGRWPAVFLALVAALVLVLIRTGPGGHTDEPTYAFLLSNAGRPVTYSSCKLIQVAVYPEGGPPDAEQLVREAVDQVRAVTGLDMVVIGAFGGHAPNWNFEAAPVTYEDPVSVSWQDGNAIAQLTDEVAGLGGSPVVENPSGGERRIAGTIALSRDYYQQLAGSGDHAEELAVLLHEFGHVVGLAHVDSSAELMYRRNIGRTTYGAGDLEGLRLLGRGPCVR